MPKPRKSLKKPRSLAFVVQKGSCYYCGQPMWNADPLALISKYSISHRQAKLLQCTGEHLVAHKDGGSCLPENIVAVCHFCNSHRHGNRKKEILPAQYRELVQKRLVKGGWHGLNLVDATLSATVI